MFREEFHSSDIKYQIFFNNSFEFFEGIINVFRHSVAANKNGSEKCNVVFDNATLNEKTGIRFFNYLINLLEIEMKLPESILKFDEQNNNLILTCSLLNEDEISLLQSVKSATYASKIVHNTFELVIDV
ncbi:hypothetical protein [Caldiplasma sukawensis]